MFPDDSDDESKSNLGATVRWFNRLSHLVGTIICMVSFEIQFLLSIK